MKAFISFFVLALSLSTFAVNRADMLKAGLKQIGLNPRNIEVNMADDPFINIAAYIGPMLAPYFMSNVGENAFMNILIPRIKLREAFFDLKQAKYNCYMATVALLSDGTKSYDLYHLFDCTMNGADISLSSEMSYGYVESTATGMRGLSNDEANSVLERLAAAR